MTPSLFLSLLSWKFQFVNFHEVMTKYDGKETAFAVSAMQEIPDQYKAICKLGLLGKQH